MSRSLQPSRRWWVPHAPESLSLWGEGGCESASEVREQCLDTRTGRIGIRGVRDAQREPMRSKKAKGGGVILDYTSLVHVGRQAREGGCTRPKAGESYVKQFAGQWRSSGDEVAGGRSLSCQDLESWAKGRNRAQSRHRQEQPSVPVLLKRSLYF